MPIDLELPHWMVERIVSILSEHPYTGAEEIVQTIKSQLEVFTDYETSSHNSMAV